MAYLGCRTRALGVLLSRSCVHVITHCLWLVIFFSCDRKRWCWFCFWGFLCWAKNGSSWKYIYSDRGSKERGGFWSCGIEHYLFSTSSYQLSILPKLMLLSLLHFSLHSLFSPTFFLCFPLSLSFSQSLCMCLSSCLSLSFSVFLVTNNYM